MRKSHIVISILTRSFAIPFLTVTSTRASALRPAFVLAQGRTLKLLSAQGPVFKTVTAPIDFR